MNTTKLHNSDEQRFSNLLKHAEEPFNPAAWELYLSFKGQLQKNTDPKPFRPHAWKYLEFDKTRQVLALILMIITAGIIGLLLLPPTKPTNTNISTSNDSIYINVDTSNSKVRKTTPSAALDSLSKKPKPKKSLFTVKRKTILKDSLPSVNMNSEIQNKFDSVTAP